MFALGITFDGEKGMLPLANDIIEHTHF